MKWRMLFNNFCSFNILYIIAIKIFKEVINERNCIYRSFRIIMHDICVCYTLEKIIITIIECVVLLWSKGIYQKISFVFFLTYRIYIKLIIMNNGIDIVDDVMMEGHERGRVGLSPRQSLSLSFSLVSV